MYGSTYVQEWMESYKCRLYCIRTNPSIYPFFITCPITWPRQSTPHWAVTWQTRYHWDSACYTSSAHHCLSALFTVVLPLDSLASIGLCWQTACLAIVSQNIWQFPGCCSKTTWVPELTPEDFTWIPLPCTTVYCKHAQYISIAIWLPVSLFWLLTARTEHWNAKGISS